MRRFTRLYMDIDATTATSRKAALMEAYFREAPAADAAVALYYLTGERPKRLLPTKVMREAVLEATGVPDWLLDECYTSVGDFSETAALLLPDNSGVPSKRLGTSAGGRAPGGSRGSGPDVAAGESHRHGADHADPRLPSGALPPFIGAESAERTGGQAASGARDGAGPSLAHVFERYVLPLGALDARAQKAMLFEAWGLFDSGERLVFNKIIRGGFRVGVQRAMVIQALAGATGLAREEVAHRLTGGVTPTAAWFETMVSPEGGAPGQRGHRPYPFFLASPLEAAPESLGDIADWQAEPKYDGIRAQVIRRGGETWLWSRGEEPIGAQFPEVVAAARGLPDGTVLDGEVLVWRGDRPLPFGVLQTRLNRKGAPAERGLFDDDRVVFVAFDLLEDGGADVRGEPLAARRGRLERVLRAGDGPRIDGDTLRTIEPFRAGSWEELAALRGGSRERGIEGLMLKHRESAYLVGRTRPADGRGWWKWKVEPYSVDAVLVYAQPGSGRRAGLHTDCTFALWDSAPVVDGVESPAARLVPFAKAYSGLTQDEIERLDAWIRGHTTAKRGPVREVEPAHVFEIGFEGLAESGRHKSGIAVRFPRILKWRTDKAVREADTLEVLRAMLGV